MDTVILISKIVAVTGPADPNASSCIHTEGGHVFNVPFDIDTVTMYIARMSASQNADGMIRFKSGVQKWDPEGVQLSKPDSSGWQEVHRESDKSMSESDYQNSRFGG